MNYHHRSHSEQPRMAASQQATGPAANAMETHHHNGANEATGSNGQPQSFIRIHSDSQQSLDQLFNPTQANTVPLRDRNLPLSFFNPSVKSDILESSAANNLAQRSSTSTNLNLHHRSVSYGHQNQPAAAAARNQIAQRRPNFHMRTSSTLAPMPSLASNNSSHQSSCEFLKQDTPMIASDTNQEATPSTGFATGSSTNLDHHHQQHQQQQQANLNHHQHHHHQSHSNSGWSSAGNSMDNLNSPGWVSSQPTLNHDSAALAQQQVAQHVHHQQQQQAMQVGSPMPHQPVMSPSHSHQNIFYSSNSSSSNGNTVAGAGASPLANHHHSCTNNLHSRSMSFNPHHQANETHQQAPGQGFHARTHSTHIAPMSVGGLNNHAGAGQLATSNHSLHRSSQELSSYPSSGITANSAAGWSSSGYSTDDMTATGGPGASNTHTWLAGQQQQQVNPTAAAAAAPPLHQQQPQPGAMQVVRSTPVNGHLTHQHHHHPHHPHDHHLNHHHHHHHMHMQAQAQHQQAHPPPQQQQLFYHV